MAIRSGRSSLKRIGGVGAVGFGVIDGAMTFVDRRSEHPDESVMKSGVMAGVNAAAWAVLPGVMLAGQGYQLAKSAGQQGWFDKSTLENKHIGNYLQGSSWNYQDTETAATMRQRATEQMMQSRGRLQGRFGNEARLYHNGAY